MRAGLGHHQINRQGAKSAKFFKGKTLKTAIIFGVRPAFLYLGVFLGVLCALVVPVAVFQIIASSEPPQCANQTLE